MCRAIIHPAIYSYTNTFVASMTFRCRIFFIIALFLPLRLLERPQNSVGSRNCFRLFSSHEVLQCSKFQVLSKARAECRRRWILVPNVDNSKINQLISKQLHGGTQIPKLYGMHITFIVVRNRSSFAPLLPNCQKP